MRVVGKCVGDTKINFGVWYCPNDGVPEEFTYCSYCVEECGCVDENDVYLLDDSITNCNCDCPNHENHPKFITLYCPECHIDFFGDSLANYSSCTMCKDVMNGGHTNNNSICEKCSYSGDLCKKCGNSIEDGQIEYENIKEKVCNLKENIKYMLPGRSKQINQYLDNVQEEANTLFENKDDLQMTYMLIEKDRKTGYKNRFYDIVYS